MSDAAIQVKTLDDGAMRRWDAFVEAAPQATFFHRAGWKTVIERAFGHRCHFLYAERDGAITGVLPLAHVRSRLFSNALISTPFCSYGGVAAADAASESRLTQAAVELAQKLKVDYLELRDLEPNNAGWPTKELYVTFSKPLYPDDDSNFKALRTKQRNMIRKGRKAGLEVHHGAKVAEFYPVYAESVRNLGTPVLPRRFFAQLKQQFDKDWDISVVTHEGRAVATAMSFYFRDQVHPLYAGSVWHARKLAANDFMYWALMQRAAARGASVFDFGRSKLDTGSYRFKKYWGFEPKPLPYAYYLVRAKEVPNLSPANPKYTTAIKAWQRLPVPVTRVLGPWLSKSLG
jgi:FemAB-related protein (PEP-CTERM system-associated)